MPTSKMVWAGEGGPGLQFPHLQIVVKKEKKKHIVSGQGYMKFLRDLPLTEIGSWNWNFDK